MALFVAVSFIVCVIYGLIFPANMHMHQFLETVLPGFKWLSVSSFFLGLVESIIWGIYIGLVYPLIYNFLVKRFAG